MNNPHDITDEEINESNAQVRKDWQAVKRIIFNRNLELEEVKEIADGWAYNGPDSLEFGLIDDIGGMDEVKEYLKTEVLNNEEVSVCW